MARPGQIMIRTLGTGPFVPLPRYARRSHTRLEVMRCFTMAAILILMRREYTGEAPLTGRAETTRDSPQPAQVLTGIIFVSEDDTLLPSIFT